VNNCFYEEQVNVWWDEDDPVCLVLNKHGMFFSVLAPWDNSPQVQMSIYSDTLSW
jgi:hypothetical protein